MNETAQKIDAIAQLLYEISHTDWRRRSMPEFLEWLEYMEDGIERGRQIVGDE